MKKTFKYLILFIFSLLVGVRVEAAVSYQEDWVKHHNSSDEYNYFYDVVGLNDGSINLGTIEYEKEDGNYFYGGSIIKYNVNGEEVWRTDKEYNYFLKGTRVSDGIVVLSQYYDEEDNAYVCLIKYDLFGNLVWEKKVEDSELNYDFIPLISLENYNDKIVLAFNNSIYVYDNSGNQIKNLSRESLLLPSVTIDGDAVYVTGVSEDANTILEKYDLSTYEKINSTIVYEATVVDGSVEDFALSLAIQSIKNNIVISTYTISGISEISIYNENLEVLNNQEIKANVFEIQVDNNFFFTFGRKQDSDPQGINKELLDYINEPKEFSFEVPVSKARMPMYYNIDKYNMDLDLEWNVSLEDFYINGLDKTNDGFVFVGEDYYGDVYSYRYKKELLTLTLDQRGFFNSNMEWLEKVITTDDGVIVAGEYEPPAPTGINDAKVARYSYLGFLTKLDHEGNVIWNIEDRDVVYLGIENVDDGFIAFACNYLESNDEPYLYLVKYDYDGNEIWKKVILKGEQLVRWDLEDISFNVLEKYILVSFCRDIYLYDINGNYINDIFIDCVNREYTININEEGIYVAFIDDEFVGHINKYDFGLNLKKEYTFSEQTYEVFSIFFIEDKVILSFDDRFLFLNSDLTEIKRMETEYKVFEMETFGNYYVASSAIYCLPKASISCDEPYLIIYDSNLNIITSKVLDFDVYDLAVNKKINDIYVVGAIYDYDEGIWDGVLDKFSFTSFNVDISTDGNGTVTSNKVIGTTGEEIEFSVEPKEGYVLKRVVVTTTSGEVLEFSDYKFTMPSEDVEIYAEFELIPNNPNTGLSNPLVIFGGILGIALVGSLVVKKKKFI